MSCEKILDIVYGTDELSLLNRAQVAVHLLFCPNCAQEVERYELCKDLLLSDFMPPSPGIENSIMAMVDAEENEAPEAQEPEVPGGFSTRGWVIAGLVMLVSLATVFLGLDFNKIALAAGMSFMIPIGITIGIALTSYGALFVGSHLKELTERFGL